MTDTSDVAPKNTPWGEKQFESEIIPGFVQVETSRHGGIWLNEQQAAQIPARLKTYSRDGNGVWWEEDCAWSLPMLYFLSRKPVVIDDEIFVLIRAIDTAREWYPTAYGAILRAAK